MSLVYPAHKAELSVTGVLVELGIGFWHELLGEGVGFFFFFASRSFLELLNRGLEL